jgi:hypothetical protein
VGAVTSSAGAGLNHSVERKLVTGPLGLHGDGFEATAGKTLVCSYYGGVYIGKNMAFDANGTTEIGYGSIASDGQNRLIQEYTVGTNTTLAKSSKWGALNLMFQYSYLDRSPWLAAAGAPRDAHPSMGFVNLRCTQPCEPPSKTRWIESRLSSFRIG